MLINEITVYKRGEIYFCNFIGTGGSVQGGLRPALILQNNIGNKFSPTLIVAPITTIIKKVRQPTHVFLGKRFGLPEESMIILEQICTVDKKEHIREYIGCIDDFKVMEEIDEKIKLSLGVQEQMKRLELELLNKLELKKNDVIYVCLCRRCRKFLDNNDYEVGRVYYDENIKEKCDWCGVNYGFDSVIRHREASSHGNK